MKRIISWIVRVASFLTACLLALHVLRRPSSDKLQKLDSDRKEVDKEIAKSKESLKEAIDTYDKTYDKASTYKAPTDSVSTVDGAIDTMQSELQKFRRDR